MSGRTSRSKIAVSVLACLLMSANAARADLFDPDPFGESWIEEVIAHLEVILESELPPPPISPPPVSGAGGTVAGVGILILGAVIIGGEIVIIGEAGNEYHEEALEYIEAGGGDFLEYEGSVENNSPNLYFYYTNPLNWNWNW